MRAGLALAAAGFLSVVTVAEASAADKILLIINGALGDKSFFDSANHGIELIKAKYADKVDQAQNLANEQLDKLTGQDQQ